MNNATVFAFAGGGSGGHLYPGLAVAEALKKIVPNSRIIFLATERDIDRRILADCGFEYIAQPVVAIPRRITAVLDFWRRWRESKRMCARIVSQHKLAAVLGLGGFASGPMLEVAGKAGVPAAMLNPDAVPGKANRFGQRRVERIFVQWQESCRFFGKNAEKCVVTGCPIRGEFSLAKQKPRDEHLAELGIEPGKKLLVVVGGSQGGKNVNDAVLAALVELSKDDQAMADWRVLHITGQADYQRMAELYRQGPLEAMVEPFSGKMPAILGAADLVIARAGASTLAELTAMGAASILLPYPYHRDQHQLRNAEVLSAVGAAEIVVDQCNADLTSQALVKTLRSCIIERSRLVEMAQAAVKIGKIDAADTIAKQLLEMSA